MYTQETDTRMGIKEFASTIKERLQADLAGVRIKEISADKNNGLRLTGISIGPRDAKMAVCIYLDGYYREYLDGHTVESILPEIVKEYREGILKTAPLIPDFCNFDAIKKLICFKLVNKEQNRERLAKIPHRDFLDLAVVYYIPVTIKEGFDGSITITNEHMAMWDAGEPILYSRAVSNTHRLFPVSLRTMEEIIKEMAPGASSPDPAFPPVYVMMCQGSSGAAAMFYEENLKEFASIHGDFYILPSSIYEVLLVPASAMQLGKEEAIGMVRSVNREQVAPEEVLSNNAYFYHADTGVIDVLL